MAAQHNDHASSPLETFKEVADNVGQFFNMADLKDIFKADAGTHLAAQDSVNKLFGPASDMLPFADSSRHNAS